MHRLVKVHGRNARENVDRLEFSCDGGGVLGRQLRAVRPVDLIPVVLLGIVAGGHIDARLAPVVPHGEAQLRRGTQRLEDPHPDPVGGAHLRGGAGEHRAVHTAVHADGDASLLGVLPLGGDDLGEALRRPPDDVYVHLVQSHLHGAPQPCGAEFQRSVEPALDLLLVPGDALQLRPLVLVQRAAVQPTLILLPILQHIQISFQACSSVSSSVTGSDSISSFASSSRESGTYRLAPYPEKPLMTFPTPPSRS